jgi:hypothetical protein
VTEGNREGGWEIPDIIWTLDPTIFDFVLSILFFLTYELGSCHLYPNKMLTNTGTYGEMERREL